MVCPLPRGRRRCCVHYRRSLGANVPHYDESVLPRSPSLAAYWLHWLDSGERTGGKRPLAFYHRRSVESVGDSEFTTIARHHDDHHARLMDVDPKINTTNGLTNQAPKMQGIWTGGFVVTKSFI